MGRAKGSGEGGGREEKTSYFSRLPLPLAPFPLAPTLRVAISTLPNLLLS